MLNAFLAATKDQYRRGSDSWCGNSSARRPPVAAGQCLISGDPITPECAAQRLLSLVRCIGGPNGDRRLARLRSAHCGFAFVSRLCADQEQTDEILQEVWLAVIRGKRSYRRVAKFKTFLFAIAHRRLVDQWRRRGRQAQAFSDAHTGSDPDQIAGETEIPEDWTEQAKLREALLAAIDQLPPPQRAVLLLRAEADLSLEEIAIATGASIEATKSRMRYALTRLRAQLADWK